MAKRILCLSDTHGMSPGDLDVASTIAILHGGDFYDGRILRYAAGRTAGADGLNELKRVTDLHWMERASVPVFAVKGNHDTSDPLEVFKRARDITGRVVEIAPNVLVAGIGWSGEQFFDLPTERDLQSVCDAVLRELSRRRGPEDRVILLTHYPGKFPELFPSKGIAGSWWYNAIRALILEVKPALVIQGHLHEHAGTRSTWKDGNCLIINPGTRGMIIELDALTRCE